MTPDGNLRVRQLASFVKVVETGKRAAAGRAFGCAASQISRDVSGLEDWLGTLLFVSQGSAELTEAGQHFLDTARRVLALLEEAKAAANPPATPMPPKSSGREIVIP